MVDANGPASACERSRTTRSSRANMRGDCRMALMPDAVIVSTARTPLCKSWRGAFNITHGATMGGHALRHALDRAALDPAEIEDVLIGCANPEGATGRNIARQIAIRAGCPVTTAGMTVNRFCSSGLQTIAIASQRIITGEGDIYAAGGVESISCVQNEMNKHMLNEAWIDANKPALDGGVVNAGNASQFSDGAGVCVVMSDTTAAKKGLKPLGVFRGFAVAGCEPAEMGIGPVFAVPKLLQRTGTKMDDVDLWEL